MSWIQTHTGRAFDFAHPRVEDVCIEDVAHALARICRFGGHTTFYSVAQHSVLVSRQLVSFAPVVQLEGLLHDAHEAYVGDVVEPLKRLPGMEVYREIEDRAWRVVAKALGVRREACPAVMVADKRMCQTERQLLGKAPKPWVLDVEPYDIKITPWAPAAAEEVFLLKYHELKKKV